MKKIERPYVGMALHTALRKLCDSAPTTILWNYFYIMPRDMWHEYCQHMFTILDALPSTSTEADVVQAIKKGSCDFADAYRDKASGPLGTESHHGLQLLNATFESMSDKDWSGYAAFVVEEMKPKKKTG